jgi:hypothetical protein
VTCPSHDVFRYDIRTTSGAASLGTDKPVEVAMSIPTLLQDLVLTALPGGGQRTARRNAWAGMSGDAARSRARREAEAALAAAGARSGGSWGGEGLHQPG